MQCILPGPIVIPASMFYAAAFQLGASGKISFKAPASKHCNWDRMHCHKKRSGACAVYEKADNQHDFKWLKANFCNPAPASW